jgi:phytoene dehydrogenase-like protein
VNDRWQERQMADRHDAVIVGSGINALVAGALLARDGWSVAVCERNDRAGGAICTRSDVFDGYTVELLSSWHPLFVGGPAYAELGEDLRRRGLTYLNTERPTGVSCADGSGVISTDPATRDVELDRLGDRRGWDSTAADFDGKADLALGLLGTDFWRPGSLRLAWTAVRRLGRRGLLAEGAELLEPAAPWLERTFSSPVTRAMLAPWALHSGLGPDDAASAFIVEVTAAMLAAAGMPVPRGGGLSLVHALVGVIRDGGGVLHTGAEVERVEVTAGRATGVRLTDGRRIRATRAVLASVPPKALYDGLLGGAHAPADRRAAAERFRHGRAAMQIHLAMSEPARWRDERLDGVALVHVLDDLDSLSESVNLATRGHLPSRPTIAVGQPATVDPSRVPPGRGLLWLQLQEVPRVLRGDHAGTIDTTAGWTPAVRDAYADRVLERVAEHVTNLDTVTDRLVLGPVELEQLDANLVGGDPYGGDCRLDQQAVWRPLSTATGHSTGVDGLWHIGASTHPGPGLGGGSGYLVASRLRAARRFRRR